MTSYHGAQLNPSQSRDINLLTQSTTIPLLYSISWVQKEMEHIDGLVQQVVDQLMDHKAITPGVWDMIDSFMHVLRHRATSKWAPTAHHNDILTKCALVELGWQIGLALLQIPDPRLQQATDILLLIIDHHATGAYPTWLMEMATNRTAFEDPPGCTSVDLKLLQNFILRCFSLTSHALQTAITEHEVRIPFDTLLPKIFTTYRPERSIKTKYAPNCPNPTPDTRTNGLAFYPLGGRQAISAQASVMIGWLKDALQEGHTLGQLAVQYKHGDCSYREVERQLACDLVTTSTVNLVLGVHMPVFGLAIHQDKAGAYICEAKPAPHPRWQSGRHMCACTGMHHTVAEFMHFGDLRELSNYLRFVSFLCAYEEWYSAEVIRYIPPNDDDWIERRAFLAFHTYGPWRNEDAEEIDTLRQSST
ncbi:hypothetical protein VKT23_013724 [Stygiomarasmius scandens]|uniref:Uncharacterized protein n=1 Tax=Marasmiellus scandens TaxID=2682957 RepID=A0ABR1J729_9AGAR